MRDVPAQVQAQIVADPLKSPMLAAVHDVAGVDRPRPTAPRLTARATAAYRERRRARRSRSSTTFSSSTYLPACRETIAAERAAERRGDVRVQREVAHDDGRRRRRRFTRSASPR